MVKYEFIYSIKSNPEKTDIQQILTKNLSQSNYRRVLERANIYFVMVHGKVFQALTGYYFTIQNYMLIT